MGGASGRAGIVVEISQSSKDVGGKMMGSMYNMVGSQESCHQVLSPCSSMTITVIILV